LRRTRRNLPYHELIGLEVSVKEHSDPTLSGLTGRVVDETRNTLVIESVDGVERIVPKHGGVFVFKLGARERVELAGSSIEGRPEDRLKRYGR
jgi:ribonuclease P protein subunit POP4